MMTTTQNDDAGQASVRIDDAVLAIDDAVRLLRRAGLIAMSRDVAAAAVALRANAHDLAAAMGAR